MLNRFLLCNKIIKAMALAAVAGTFIIGLEEAIGLAAIIFTAFGLSIGGSLIFRDTGFTVKSEEEIKQPPQAKDESKNTDTIYTPNLKNNSPYINCTIGLGLVKIQEKYFFQKKQKKNFESSCFVFKKKPSSNNIPTFLPQPIQNNIPNSLSNPINKDEMPSNTLFKEKQMQKKNYLKIKRW